jgi:hypothetical protein
MAGSYPDAPANRAAYHEDGTVVWRAHNAYAGGGWAGMDPETITEWPVDAKKYANDESHATIDGFLRFPHNGALSAAADRWFFGFVFPETRDILGGFWWHGGVQRAGNANAGISNVQISPDSTNAVDGTWTTVYGSPTSYLYNQVSAAYGGGIYYRIIPQSWPGPKMRAYRFSLEVPFVGILVIADVGLYMAHIYTNITDDTIDRLALIDEATGLEFTSLIDWGDVPRGTTLTREFRVKNLSSTQTATNVEVKFDDNPAPGNTAWMTVADYGGGFVSSFTITSIAPGATYPAGGPITIQLDVPAGGQLSLDSMYLMVGPPTWT